MEKIYWVILCISCQDTIVLYSIFSNSLSSLVLNCPGNGTSTTSPGSLCHSLIDLIVKRCFQIFNLNYTQFQAISAKVSSLVFISLKYMQITIITLSVLFGKPSCVSTVQGKGMCMYE